MAAHLLAVQALREMGAMRVHVSDEGVSATFPAPTSDAAATAAPPPAAPEPDETDVLLASS